MKGFGDDPKDLSDPSVVANKDGPILVTSYSEGYLGEVTNQEVCHLNFASRAAPSSYPPCSGDRVGHPVVVDEPDLVVGKIANGCGVDPVETTSKGQHVTVGVEAQGGGAHPLVQGDHPFAVFNLMTSLSSLTSDRSHKMVLSSTMKETLE